MKVLRRSMAAAAAIAVAVLLALGSAGPAVADGGGELDPNGEWNQPVECNSFQLGSLCLDFAVIGES